MKKNKKISVLMFDAAFPFPIKGGKEKQAYLLSRMLNEYKINVSAFSYKHNGNKSELVNEINVQRFNSGKLFIIKSFYFLLLMRFKYNILHIHTPSRVGLLLILLGRICFYKVVFKFPGERLFIKNKSFLWRFITQRAHTLVVLEKNTYNRLIKRGYKSCKIFMIANGVEVGVKKQLSKAGKLELIFLGRLDPVKNCDDILKACKKLDEQYQDWHLNIVGDGILFDDLLELSSNLNILKKVTFLGYQSNPKKWMEKADIFILASTTEGMSNSMLEAMSIGLPIVTTKLPSVESMLGEDYKYSVDVGDFDSLAKKIYELATNFDEREALSKYIYERCNDNFSIQAITKHYIDNYNALL